ncbi:hypothetical protein [Porphyromonas pogonae]|uniref:hypothetical protein n=1 Tax=Porphyromonas pogonae TaxID=867595 RepID=UPI002E7632E9|nr:hypothetical protein [Porphyromonas pogonae]
MILIAESGSTKAQWTLLERGEIIEQAYTEGINPYFQSRREISRAIRLGLPEGFFRTKITKGYYYGAGCNTPEKIETVSASLTAQFRTPFEVESDLLGAARGLFGKDQGIACILGTGSNSCYYNGDIIVRNIKSGGYLLGDEGSLAVAGKTFLADVVKEYAPKEITEHYFETFATSTEYIMETLYRKPLPNKFLSETGSFLYQYIDNNYIYRLFLNHFRQFFERCVCQYDYNALPTRIVGSHADHLSEILRIVAKEYGIQLDLVCENAMAGLVNYHEIDSFEGIHEPEYYLQNK